MSRDLPFFKFYTGEWLNGDITLEDLELQGLFINVCAYYWHKGCDLTVDQVNKRFKTDRIYELVKLELIDLYHHDECDQISIRFLDEQYQEFDERRKILSEAGKKGAKRKKELTTLQPTLSHPLTLREEGEQEEEEKKIKTGDPIFDWSGLVNFFNATFNKACKVVPEKAKKQYKARLKEGYTKDNIVQAMKTVKNDEWHKNQDFKYATILYFSQTKTLETYGQNNTKQTEKYVPR